MHNKIITCAELIRLVKTLILLDKDSTHIPKRELVFNFPRKFKYILKEYFPDLKNTSKSIHSLEFTKQMISDIFNSSILNNDEKQTLMHLLNTAYIREIIPELFSISKPEELNLQVVNNYKNMPEQVINTVSAEALTAFENSKKAIYIYLADTIYLKTTYQDINTYLPYLSETIPLLQKYIDFLYTYLKGSVEEPTLQFVSLKKHDIKNQLAIIYQNLNLLKEEISNKDKSNTAELLDILFAIYRARIGILNLLNEIPGGKSRGTEKLKRLNIKKFVEESVIPRMKTFFAGSDITFMVKQLNIPTSIYFNIQPNTFLTSGLDNVLTNIMDIFTLGTLSAQKDKTVLLSAEFDKDIFSLSVEDNGLGIPAAVLEALHKEIPLTTKESGSGFGLQSVRWILRKSNGDFEIRNNPAKQGTIVTFKFRTNLSQQNIEDYETSALLPPEEREFLKALGKNLFTPYVTITYGKSSYYRGRTRVRNPEKAALITENIEKTVKRYLINEDPEKREKSIIVYAITPDLDAYVFATRAGFNVTYGKFNELSEYNDLAIFQNILTQIKSLLSRETLPFDEDYSQELLKIVWADIPLREKKNLSIRELFNIVKDALCTIDLSDERPIKIRHDYQGELFLKFPEGFDLTHNDQQIWDKTTVSVYLNNQTVTRTTVSEIKNDNLRARINVAKLNKKQLYNLQNIIVLIEDTSDPDFYIWPDDTTITILPVNDNPMANEPIQKSLFKNTAFLTTLENILQVFILNEAPTKQASLTGVHYWIPQRGIHKQIGAEGNKFIVGSNLPEQQDEHLYSIHINFDFTTDIVLMDLLDKIRHFPITEDKILFKPFRVYSPLFFLKPFLIF